MPTRNIVKIYTSDTYYHIYSRGVNKQAVFVDEADFAFFLSLLKRYLSSNPAKRKKHSPYRSFAGEMSLLAYCLMGNHFHLLVYQHENPLAIQQLMRRVMTSYSMYFNKRHNRVGPVFQSSYLGARITDDPYLYHISRYIHKNPANWFEYPFSSLRYYSGSATSGWIKTRPILDLFDNDSKQYLDFLTEDTDQEMVLDHLAHE